MQEIEYDIETEQAVDSVIQEVYDYLLLKRAHSTFFNAVRTFKNNTRHIDITLTNDEIVVYIGEPHHIDGIEHIQSIAVGKDPSHLTGEYHPTLRGQLERLSLHLRLTEVW